MTAKSVTLDAIHAGIVRHASGIKLDGAPTEDISGIVQWGIARVVWRTLVSVRDARSIMFWLIIPIVQVKHLY